MPNPAVQLIAGGTIYPSRFITPDTSDDHEAIQATANAIIIGVSGQGTNYPPIDEIITDPQPHATIGQHVEVISDGDICILEAGSAITMANPRLKADSVGRAVPIETTGTTIQNYGAIALEAASAAGEKIRVLVTTCRETRPALA